MGWAASSSPRCTRRGNNRLTKLAMSGDMNRGTCGADEGGLCSEGKGAVVLYFSMGAFVGFWLQLKKDGHSPMNVKPAERKTCYKK